MSIDDKFQANIKQGFKRAFSWNKYRPEIAAKPKGNNIDYTIDPGFKNINRLLVLSFKNPDNDLGRDSYDKYYVPLEEIKYFNTLINDKPFFDQNVEKKAGRVWKTCWNIKKRWLYNRKFIRLFVPSKIF